MGENNHIRSIYFVMGIIYYSEKRDGEKTVGIDGSHTF